MSKVLQGITIVLLIVLIVIMFNINTTLRNLNYNTLKKQNTQIENVLTELDTQKKLLDSANTKLYNIQLYIDEIDDILNDKFYGKVGNYTQALTQ